MFDHFQLPPSVAQVTEQVIREANREHPADAVLRETFKRLRVLNAEETRQISNAVFAYFRWQGWISEEKDLRSRIQQALDLAAEFRAVPDRFPVDARAVPEWTVAEVNCSEEWFRALQAEPQLWLRARRGRGSELAAKLDAARTVGPPDAVLYEGEEDLFRTPEFHAGEFELQDISSQAVGFICDPQPGETWWDACAGEGGKMLHLSELMQNKGLIWASDRATWRLQKLKRRAGRAKVFNYRSAPWNGGAKLPTKTKFDGVLVDAPCSGVGTWQRNPHARWTTTPEDVKELAAIQKQLLANAASAIKPGGKLVYAVCTLTRAETDEVANQFESQFKDFEPWPAANPLNREISGSARIWIWPQDSGGNGMFVAVWRRKS